MSSYRIERLWQQMLDGEDARTALIQTVDNNMANENSSHKRDAPNQRKTVWKYEIGTNLFQHDMPKGAIVRCAQVQRGTPQMWVEVCPDHDKETRYFETVGTGHPLPPGDGFDRVYIDTFQLQDGALVFHLYERIYE